MHLQGERSRCKVKSTPCANDYKHFPVFPTLQTRLWGYGYRHMRSLATKVVRSWISLVGVQTLFITPGGPCENGIIESFNRRLRDECLNVERFFTLEDVRECGVGSRTTIRFGPIVRWRIKHPRRLLPSGSRRPRRLTRTPLNYWRPSHELC